MYMYIDEEKLKYAVYLPDKAIKKENRYPRSRGFCRPGVQKIAPKHYSSKHRIIHSISGIGIERHLGHLGISTADSPNQQNILCIGTKVLRVSMAPVTDPLAQCWIKGPLGFRRRSVVLPACRIAYLEGRIGCCSIHEDL